MLSVRVARAINRLKKGNERWITIKEQENGFHFTFLSVGIKPREKEYGKAFLGSRQTEYIKQCVNATALLSVRTAEERIALFVAPSATNKQL